MIGNSRKVYTVFAETNDVSKVCPSLHFVTTFPHMQRAFFSRVDSGAPRVKRASGAPWVNKSTYPRKFGNHVTDRPSARPTVRTTGIPMFTLTLSSYFGSPGESWLHIIDSFGWEMRRLSKPIIRFRMASVLFFTLLDAYENYKGSSDPCLTW